MMQLKKGTSVYAKVLNAKRLFTAQKIINTALDGTTYIQNTGNAITRYELDIYCATATLRDLVDEACNDGARLTLVFENLSTIDGFIEDETIEWKCWKDGHGVSKIKFIKE